MNFISFSKINVGLFSFFVSFTVFAAGGRAPTAPKPPAKPRTGSCRVLTENFNFQKLVETYVPRGSNGRAAAAAIYRVDSKGQLQQSVVEKNSRVAQAVASTQKILSAYTAFLVAKNMSDRETFTSDDLFFDAQGNRALYPKTNRVVQVGERPVLSEYLYTTLMQSSNGGAHALGRGAALGDIRKFMDLMNAQARKMLGDSAVSYFQNPSGLTDTDDRYKMASDPNRRQQSNAFELARLMGLMMGDSSYREYLQSLGFPYADKGFLWKTGLTQAAGRTVVFNFGLPARCGGQMISAAFFGENTAEQRDRYNTLYAELKKKIEENLD